MSPFRLRPLLPSVAWLGALCIGTALALAGARSRPSLAECAQPDVISLGEHDFGILVGNQRREHEFRLRNDSGATWRVARTFEECGCARVVDATREVPAGADFILRVRIDSHGILPELFVRRAYAELEPDGRLLEATLRASIQPAVRVDPGVAALELGAREVDFRTEFTVVAPQVFGYPRISSAGASSGLAVELGEPWLDGLAWKAKGIARGMLERGSPRGDFSHSLRLESSDPDVPPELVALRVEVRRPPALVALPSFLVLAPSQGEPSGEAYLRTAEGVAPTSIAWRSEPEGAVRVDYDSATGRVTISASAADSAGVERCRVELTAGDDRARVEVILPRPPRH